MILPAKLPIMFVVRDEWLEQERRVIRVAVSALPKERLFLSVLEQRGVKDMSALSMLLPKFVKISCKKDVSNGQSKTCNRI